MRAATNTTTASARRPVARRFMASSWACREASSGRDQAGVTAAAATPTPPPPPPVALAGEAAGGGRGAAGFCSLTPNETPPWFRGPPYLLFWVFLCRGPRQGP